MIERRLRAVAVTAREPASEDQQGKANSKNSMLASAPCPECRAIEMAAALYGAVWPLDLLVPALTAPSAKQPNFVLMAVSSK